MAQKLADYGLKSINIGKALAADAVEHKGNGHPGTAVALSGAAYSLYQKIMNVNPKNPNWIGRDRFILSIGHSSLTQYIQLYLGGFGLELDDLKKLRTLGSLTPGHPEYGHTAGIEMTTGPLGQGLASGVGFAMSSRYEHGLFDKDAKPGESVFDHNVFVLAGDGDMQEGITSEASSLAGTQKLGNLIVIYDDNHISIEDDTKIAFTEDVIARYKSYGWHTQQVEWLKKDGSYEEDYDALIDAVEAAKKVTDKPSLISLRTLIAWPVPNKTNSGSAHGNKLGKENISEMKKILGLPDEEFWVDEDAVNKSRAQLAVKGKEAEAEWQGRFDSWAAANPEGKKLFDRLQAHKLPEGLESALPKYDEGSEIATRVASNEILNALSSELPELWGGSADLAGSNGTSIKGADSFNADGRSTDEWPGNPYGKILHFGIREHAMGAILNGIVLGGVSRPFGGTFLVFSDYMRGAVRLAALMKIPSIYIWTHDSIAVGEDGPTHQPIEHVASLRAIPNLDVVRPADANELAQCYLQILENRDNPVGLILTRQNVPNLPRGKKSDDAEFFGAEGARKGGYILLDPAGGNPDVILIATGSEVQLAVSAAKELQSHGVKARIVSMPCVEWFERQSQEYRDKVLPPSVKTRVSAEAGIAMPWHKYLGDAGIAVSVETYGISAPEAEVFEHFGLNSQSIFDAATESIEKLR